MNKNEKSLLIVIGLFTIIITTILLGHVSLEAKFGEALASIVVVFSIIGTLMYFVPIINKIGRVT